MDGTNHMSMDHANHEHANHMHHMNMDHMMPPDHEMPLNSTFENDIITNAINSSEDNLDYNSDLRSHAHHGHGGLNAHAGHEIHGDHSMGNHDMAMTFHGGYAETILFSWWKVTDVGEFIGSFFAVFLMALLYEGLKYYRKHLLWKTYTGLQYCAVSPPDKGVSNICTPDEPQTDQKQCYSVNGFAYRFTINKVFNLITDESAFDAALGSASQLTSPQIKTNQYVIEYQRSEFTAIQKPVPHVLERNIPTMMSTAHAWQTILHGVQVLVSYMLMLVFMSYNTWLCAAVVLGSATGYFLFGWRESVVVDFTEHCH